MQEMKQESESSTYQRYLSALPPEALKEVVLPSRIAVQEHVRGVKYPKFMASRRNLARGARLYGSSRHRSRFRFSALQSDMLETILLSTYNCTLPIAITYASLGAIILGIHALTYAENSRIVHHANGILTTKHPSPRLLK